MRVKSKLELKEWITELACSLDRGDLKIDELMNEVEFRGSYEEALERGLVAALKLIA